MNRLLLIVTFLLSFKVYSQETPFVFNKDKIDTGNLYTYEISDTKRFKPIEKVYIYIKGTNDIEQMYVSLRKKSSPYLNRLTMNWKYMMFSKLEGKYTGSKEDLSIKGIFKMVSKVDFSKMIMYNNFTRRTDTGLKEDYNTTRIKKIPTYFYGMTDLIPLCLTLRFYPFPKKKIRVNIIKGFFDMDTDIKYLGKEKVEVPYGEVLTYKFGLAAKGLMAAMLAKKAWIWLSAESKYMYMVKYRNDNRRTTFSSMVEYRLAERKKISLKEWEELKKRFSGEKK